MKQFLPQMVRRKLGRIRRNMVRRNDGAMGVDFVKDIRERLPRLEVQTIFDVGAFIGLAAIEYSDAFPKAIIYSFEPSLENLTQLRANIPNNPCVQSYQIALGDRDASGEFKYFSDHPSTSRLVEPGTALIESGGEMVEVGGTAAVQVKTLDTFTKENGIDRIDLLKIDTEGHEMSVLKGAARTLAEGKIKLVLAECTCDPAITYHTAMSKICDFLFPLGYRVFGFYNQGMESPQGAKHQSRFDIVFFMP